MFTRDPAGSAALTKSSGAAQEASAALVAVRCRDDIRQAGAAAGRGRESPGGRDAGGFGQAHRRGVEDPAGSILSIEIIANGWSADAPPRASPSTVDGQDTAALAAVPVDPVPAVCGHRPSCCRPAPPSTRRATASTGCRAGLTRRLVWSRPAGTHLYRRLRRCSASLTAGTPLPSARTSRTTPRQAQIPAAALDPQFPAAVALITRQIWSR